MHLHGDEEEPDETELIDWITLVTCIVGCLYLIGGLIALKITLNRKYTPIKSTNLPKLQWMTVFGIIHIFGTLIANDHFHFFAILLAFDCSFITYWVQYYLGLNAWFLVLILRILSCSYIFNNKLAWINETPGLSRKVNVIVTLLLTIPVGGLCLGITLTHASVFDYHIVQCYTEAYWRYAMLGWIVCCILSLVALTLYLKDGVKVLYINEFRPLLHIIIFCVMITILDAYIHFSTLYMMAIGRSVMTMSIVALHVFTFTRLIGYRLWMAITNNQSYKDMFMNSYRVVDLTTIELSDLEAIATIRRKFLDYCEKQERINPPKNMAIESEPIIPMHLVNCYLALDTFIHHECSDVYMNPQITLQKLQPYLEKYFTPYSAYYIPLDPELILKMKTQIVIKNIAPVREVQWKLFECLKTLFGPSFIQQREYVKSWSDLYDIAQHELDPAQNGDNIILLSNFTTTLESIRQSMYRDPVYTQV